MAELILCDECNTHKRADGAHHHEGIIICGRCWPKYAEDNGLCESCGTPLEPIYDNVGFTEPAGPSKWEIVDYKPCVECKDHDDQED